MGRQGGGRLRTSIVDRWARILDSRSQQPRPSAPIAPAEHVEVKWCGCRWECACEPTAKPPGATRD
jgi:hypothetical protein